MRKIEITNNLESKRNIYDPLLFSYSICHVDEKSTARTKLV